MPWQCLSVLLSSLRWYYLPPLGFYALTVSICALFPKCQNPIKTVEKGLLCILRKHRISAESWFLYHTVHRMFTSFIWLSREHPPLPRTTPDPTGLQGSCILSRETCSAFGFSILSVPSSCKMSTIQFCRIITYNLK